MNERTSGDFEGLFETVDRNVDESDNMVEAVKLTNEVFTDDDVEDVDTGGPYDKPDTKYTKKEDPRDPDTKATQVSDAIKAYLDMDPRGSDLHGHQMVKIINAYEGGAMQFFRDLATRQLGVDNTEEDAAILGGMINTYRGIYDGETVEEDAEGHGIDMDDDLEEGCDKKHKKAKKVLESDGPYVNVEALKQQYKLINREVDFGSLVTEDLELMDGLNSFLQDTIERAGGSLDTVMRPGIK